MNETLTDDVLRGKTVVTEDGVALGSIDALTATHLRVAAADDMVVSEQLWLPRAMVAGLDGDEVRLNRERGDIHDAVYSLAPGQQREYATLKLSIPIGRERGLKVGESG